MKRRIFISIDIPEKSKKRLFNAVSAWQDLPVKWVREENLHITLVFLGLVSDDAIAEICSSVRKTVEKHEIFDLEFTEISLAPDRKNPKMVWLTGNANEELKILQENIEKTLGIFAAPKKSFAPHIALGRIRARKWGELESKPEILVKFPMIVGVCSVEIVASNFEGDGPEYTIIESCPLT